MDNNQFIFRKLEASDLADTYEIRFSCKENIIHPHQIQYLLRDTALSDIGQGGGWMCLDGNVKVGFSMPIFAPEPMLAALFVRPEYQKRGIGKKLMQLAVNWLKENNADSIILETDPGSFADEFYKRNGWERGEMAEYGLQVIYRMDLTK